ncbi:hypothetical protein ONZ45_g17564 [Pleurotus djamor]|nr:hypothetical protein ONZ45_g17564 [Pleurotus djamor]
MQGLPPELWLKILGFASDTKTLLTLIVTSRQLNQLSEALLYENIELNYDSESGIFNFPSLVELRRTEALFQRLSANSHLARRVHTLRAPIHETLAHVAPFLVNLRRLALFAYYSDDHPKAGVFKSLTQFSLLTHFVWCRDGDDQSEMWRFLETQDMLEHLAFFNHLRRRELPVLKAGSLPNLRSLVTPDEEEALAFVQGRDIQHLNIISSFYSEDRVQPSAVISPAMKTLSCLVKDAPHLMKQYPNVKYLEIQEQHRYERTGFKFSIPLKGDFHATTHLPELQVIDIVLDYGKERSPNFYRYRIGRGLAVQGPLRVKRSQGLPTSWDLWWEHCGLPPP